MDLRAELADLPRLRSPSRWPGWEHVNGYVVHSLPFSSGHVLAVRVLPQNDFAPYVTLWHRTPGGEWSIHVDAPSVEIACPRYFGPATRHVARARIAVSWTGPNELRVRVDEPSLDLRVSVGASRPLRLLNACHGAMPFVVRRSRVYARLMELMARVMLDMGRITMEGTTPSGHRAVIMPTRILYVTDARAVLDGNDLGEPSRVATPPRIGEVGLPARPTFAVGGGFFRILDPEEYQRTVERLRADASP